MKLQINVIKFWWFVLDINDVDSNRIQQSDVFYYELNKYFGIFDIFNTMKNKEIIETSQVVVGIKALLFEIWTINNRTNKINKLLSDNNSLQN